MRKVATLFLAVFVFVACEAQDMHMHHQLSIKPQESPRKMNPEGAIPITGFQKSYEDVDGITIEAPFELTDAVGVEGKKLYDIYCAVCHAEDGKVQRAPVVAKFDVEPFDLTDDTTIGLTDGEIFVKILASDAVMPNYRNELTDDEAWGIVAYVRKLQSGS